MTLARVPVSDNDEKQKSTLRVVAEAMALTMDMALSVVVGVVLGYELDRWLGTSPLFLFVFLAGGFAAGIKTLLILLKRFGQ